MKPHRVAIRALSANQLLRRLRQLGLAQDGQGRWAVALSGGPDSMALAALLAKLGPLRAFIVDHGLREEAAREARLVQRRARALGITSHILKWQGEKPLTGIMAAARLARYRLLVEACQRYGCTHLFLAHHLDDQLETVAMRRAEGSGWRGLAGMPALAQLGQVTLVRPLLDVPKAALLTTCEKLGVKTVDDPSNRNPKYTRARMRLEGRTYTGIAACQHKAAARRNRELANLVAKGGFALHEGWATYTQPKADLLRLLLQHVGQDDKPVRQDALDALVARLKAGQGATLAGCIVQDGLAVREPAAVMPLDLPAGRYALWWDNRWALKLVLSSPHRLAPLGKNTPWRQVAGANWLEVIPGLARAGLPALWQDGRLVALPKGRWQPYYHPMSQVFVEK